MTKKYYETTIDGFIDCLTDIKKYCGGNTPVQINPIGGECVTGISSICLDNDEGNDNALVYLETEINLNNCPKTFEFYTQGGELD